jgi:hypothetical protein
MNRKLARRGKGPEQSQTGGRLGGGFLRFEDQFWCRQNWHPARRLRKASSQIATANIIARCSCRILP